jgi:hypothetical protein
MSNYLIAHIGHTTKSWEHIVWWKPDSCGYTVCIEKAGLYSEDEARKICQYGMCIAVPKAVAEVDARSTPYYRCSNGTLNKMYDGGPHRVVPNDLQVWKRLISGCLAKCEQSYKPTPIGAKARAIYIDGIAVEAGAA